MKTQTEESTTLVECANPSCNVMIEIKNGRGRKRRTCSDRCRKVVSRLMRRLRSMRTPGGVGPSVLK